MRNRLVGKVPGRVVAGLCMAWFALSSLIAAEPLADSDDIFRSTNLLRISIEIPLDGMQALRESHMSRNANGKTEAQATVIEAGRTYTNVSVQLKGFSTFQPIDRQPSLTLNFSKNAPKQKFHGLTKLSLNNSLQDPSRLHEKLSREVFAAAGVPVPRADYAVVTLNSNDLGLYVLTEGFNKEFLKRHFKRSDGLLYEGGVLRDIDQPLQIDGGRTNNDANVLRLIIAAHEPDGSKRIAALEAVLDLDRFLSMLAVETILCHSDSYSMNRNNYRLYHDPTTGRFVFIPHGMDRVLGTHRSPLDLSVVPPVLGIVARAVLSTPEGRRRHVERVGLFVTNLFDPERLCARVRELDAVIISAKTNEPSNRGFDRRPARSAAEDAANLCDRISERALELKFQLADVQEWLVPPPRPEFDTNGIASIANWKPKRVAARPEPLDTKIENQIWHLRSTNGPLMAAFRSRVTLPAGSYRIIGEHMATNSAGATNLISLTLVRHPTRRYDVDRQFVNGRSINLSFQVNADRAPEEIELICDIRDNGPEAWFDARSLKLIREQK